MANPSLLSAWFSNLQSTLHPNLARAITAINESNKRPEVPGRARLSAYVGVWGLITGNFTVSMMDEDAFVTVKPMREGNYRLYSSRKLWNAGRDDRAIGVGPYGLLDALQSAYAESELQLSDEMARAGVES